MQQLGNGQHFLLAQVDLGRALGDQVGRQLIQALREEKIALTIMPAASFPQQALALQSYDAVILDDVPRDSFSDAQMRAIEAAVHDEGIGLCMIGGEHSFGAGDWRVPTESRGAPPAVRPGDRLLAGDASMTVEALLDHPRCVRLPLN